MGAALFTAYQEKPYDIEEVYDAGGGLEFSIATGGGLEYALPKGNLLFDFRLTFGIWGDYETTSVISVMTGYGF